MKSDAGVIRWMRAALMALPALFVLAGCGGSGSIVAGGGTGGTGISAGVITDKGSVVVNDVRFAVDDNTSIRLNDIDNVQESELQIGMIVKLRGTFNADGSTGTADSIEAEGNVQGRISVLDLGEGSFSVLGQKTFVDNQTIFAGVGGLNELELGNVVRVFGFRDVPGDIRATFVERLSGSGGEEEIFGIVSEKDVVDNTFMLNGFLLVDYVIRNPEIEPPGSSFDNGDPVEVEGVFNVGTGRFEATEIEREDIEDAEFIPLEGEKVEVEGFASDVTEIAPGIFTLLVYGFPVRTNAGTSYEGGATGTSADLINNVRVEAEGVWTMIGVDLVLVAEEIEFE
jgi:hypothetical protein